MSEVHVERAAEHVRIFAKSHCCGISCDGSKHSERYRESPTETIHGFGVRERGVVRNDHYVALDCVAVMDIEISLVGGFWVEVGGRTADCGLQTPIALIELLEWDGVGVG
jgi:hypothetical protein